MSVGAMFQAAFQTPALPLFHAAMRVLSLPPPKIGAVCDRQWTIAPAVQARRRQAVFLPGQLGRVLEVQEDTTLPHELGRVNAGPVEHGETRAYLLRNALIQDGMLYKGRYRAKLLLSGGRDLPRPPTVVTERGSLAASAMGNRYFAHWLIDDCTLQGAIALDPDSLGRPHAIAREMSRHELEYSELLGFSPTRVGNAFFSELVVLDDRGQNRFKRARYEWMRNTLLRAVGLPAEPPSHPGVFVVRGTAGARRVLKNENEIAQRLASRRGLRVLDPMRHSVKEIVRTCAGARVVVGVEGGSLAQPLILMTPGTAMICLQPPARFNNSYGVSGNSGA